MQIVNRFRIMLFFFSLFLDDFFEQKNAPWSPENKFIWDKEITLEKENLGQLLSPSPQSDFLTLLSLGPSTQTQDLEPEMAARKTPNRMKMDENFGIKVFRL